MASHRKKPEELRSHKWYGAQDLRPFTAELVRARPDRKSVV